MFGQLRCVLSTVVCGKQRSIPNPAAELEALTHVARRIEGGNSVSGCPPYRSRLRVSQGTSRALGSSAQETTAERTDLRSWFHTADGVERRGKIARFRLAQCLFSLMHPWGTLCTRKPLSGCGYGFVGFRLLA